MPWLLITPRKKNLHILWMGLRAGHCSLEKRKVFAPDRNQDQIPQLSCSLVTILLVLFGDGGRTVQNWKFAWIFRTFPTQQF